MATAAIATEPWFTHRFGRIWRFATDAAARAPHGTDATDASPPALPEIVQRRAERFVQAEHHARYVHAHRTLNAVLAPTTWRVGSYGKPDTDGPAFNLSRRDGWAAFILGHDATPVGIDLEVMRPVDHADELAQEHFTRAEIDEWQAVPPDERSRAFLRVWTRKEAVMKAAGLGLWLPAASFQVGLAAEAVRVPIDSPNWRGEIEVASLPDARPTLIAIARVCG